MNYNEFRAFLATFLWKDNDVALLQNIDQLVKMAEAELNRSLDISRRDVASNLTASANPTALPSDFRHMLSVTSADGHRYFSSLFQDVTARTAALQGQSSLRLYCVHNKQLYITDSFTAPVELVIEYRANVPNFKASGVSWLAEDFLDLYTYTTLSHTAPFLREDERIALWQGLKDKALDAALTEDKWAVGAAASPTMMYPARTPPRTRR